MPLLLLLLLFYYYLYPSVSYFLATPASKGCPCSMISSVSSSHGLCHFCLCTAVTRSPENRGFIRSLILRLVSCSVALGLMCPLCTLDLGTRSLHQPCRIRLPLPAKWFSGVLDFPNPLFYTNKTNKDIGHSPLCSCGLLAPVYRRGPFPPIPCARSVLGFRFVQAKSTVAFVESSSQVRGYLTTSVHLAFGSAMLIIWRGTHFKGLETLT